MKRPLAVPVLALCLLLAQLGFSSAQAPDGVIELSGSSIALGIGYSWGEGTAYWQGAPLDEEKLPVAAYKQSA
jgi:hypothetical protein